MKEDNMSEDNKYNGWSNYETWLVKLWLDNDEYICNHQMPEWASDCDGSVGVLADTVKEFVADPENGLVPDFETGLGADLLSAALSSVDWFEIAESILEDNPQNENEDESEDSEDLEDATK